MSNEKDTLSKYDDLILEKMGELLNLRSNTWKWVVADHTEKDTETRLNEIRILSDEISKIAHGLVDYKKTRANEGQEVGALLKRFELLHDYEQDIQGCLADDLKAKKKSAADNKFDVVKDITFLFGLPIAFVSAVKNGVGNGHIPPNDALYVGFAISIPTIFRKPIKSGFSQVANAICTLPETLQAAPAAIQNDFRIYYTREIIKEKTDAARVCLEATAKSINQNIHETCERTVNGLRKVWGRRSPRL